ncbi:MAG: uncharacterized protein KVP18_004934 [Porospora cf. gigantea A]|uniref:uncharacterized protein n=1 Tax=Porospora cf. gigantea A TaxID=2853593 RepID=UPI003559B86F|nr:MAG: hypothetical protein KVP18_004934 [Porospora cf. gigantea A]
MDVPEFRIDKLRNGRTRVAALVEDEVYAYSKIGDVLTVCGWAKTIRKQGGGAFAFLALNDGSSHKNLQVMVTKESCENYEDVVKSGTGASFRIVGTLEKSPAEGQLVELKVTDSSIHSAVVLGRCPADKYPLAKKKHGREFLREIAHLRPRSYLIGVVARVRSQMAMATHTFFQTQGFQYIHTPLITSADCEGAGEMFQVTTALPESNKMADVKTVKDKGYEVDYKKDFFGRKAFLTVSGQLAVENYCCALSDVYTFGPTFRAENSHTSRHLAEFWMIEPEVAFADLEVNMELAEKFVKYLVQWAMKHCAADLDWLNSNEEIGLKARLEQVVQSDFARLPYFDAVKLLISHSESGQVTFTEKPFEGMDMASEHERYLTEKVYEKPLIVYNYPKEFKAFYMKANDDGRTVKAMDVLVPKIGELIGGSERENDLEKLDAMMKEKEVDAKSLWWYRDLRTYGSVPHSGFGLGFERLVMFITGVENIRDVIPYPRFPGHAEF